MLTEFPRVKPFIEVRTHSSLYVTVRIKVMTGLYPGNKAELGWLQKVHLQNRPMCSAEQHGIAPSYKN